MKEKPNKNTIKTYRMKKETSERLEEVHYKLRSDTWDDTFNKLLDAHDH